MSTNEIILWIPGRGISTDALERMRERFKQPDELMGEAWFIGGERRVFPELADRKKLFSIKPWELATILFEISSGTSSFGPMDEWNEWFKFLLPDLTLRSVEDQYFNTLLAQEVATDFMAVFWDGIPDEYPEFRTDVMRSLFQVLMDSALWNNGMPIFLDQYENGRDETVLGWGQGRADENVSAMMMFGLKYLEAREIAPWLRSIIAIDDIHWRGNFLVWLESAYDVLSTDYIDPSTFGDLVPDISWDHSHVLNPDRFFEQGEKPFLPKGNRVEFIKEIRELMTDGLLIDWAASFAADALVEQSTWNVPELLMAKFAAID